MPEWSIELPEAWQTAPFDPAMTEVIAEVTLPKGRTALLVVNMLEDGTNVLALTWDRGVRLARIAAPDWKVEERFTGRPPGPGEGALIGAWRVGIESLMRSAREAAAEEAADPEGSAERSRALWVLRHPDALAAAWEAFCAEHDGRPPVTRELFEEGVKLLAGLPPAEGEASDA
jgi:hypothetical protein